MSTVSAAPVGEQTRMAGSGAQVRAAAWQLRRIKIQSGRNGPGAWKQTRTSPPRRWHCR
jgi:hypothetical protein